MTGGLLMTRKITSWWRTSTHITHSQSSGPNRGMWVRAKFRYNDF